MDTEQVESEQGAIIRSLNPTNGLFIGGSDIAKLLGLSNYGGPLEVYQRIVEGLDAPWSALMERGAATEPLLRAHGQRMWGFELEPNEGEYIYSAAYPFARAQIDDLARWQGQPVVLEYKSQNEFRRGWLHGAQGDSIPADYEAQMTWQLMCADRELALAIVGFGQDRPDGSFELNNIQKYEFQRDREFEAYCLLVAREFWEKHIVTRTPPPATRKRSRRAA